MYQLHLFVLYRYFIIHANINKKETQIMTPNGQLIFLFSKMFNIYFHKHFKLRIFVSSLHSLHSHCGSVP